MILKVDLEHKKSFQIRKLQIVVASATSTRIPRSLLKSSLSFYLKAKLTKHLYCMQREEEQGSFFRGQTPRKCTSTKVSLCEFSHQSVIPNQNLFKGLICYSLNHTVSKEQFLFKKSIFMKLYQFVNFRA